MKPKGFCMNVKDGMERVLGEAEASSSRTPRDQHGGPTGGLTTGPLFGCVNFKSAAEELSAAQEAGAQWLDQRPWMTSK